MKKKSALYTITFCIMAFIFIQSAMPDTMSSHESIGITRIIADMLGVSVEDCVFWVRKVAHFTEFAGLGLFMCLSLACDEVKMKLLLLKTWVGGSVWAVSDEVHQLFVNGRACQLRDMCIDSAGVLAGTLVALCIVAFARRRKKDNYE